MVSRRPKELQASGYNDLRRISPPENGRFRAGHRTQDEAGKRVQRDGLHVDKSHAGARQGKTEKSSLAARWSNEYLEGGQALTRFEGMLRFFDECRTVWKTYFDGRSGQTVMNKIMIAFDVETTGKNPETDQIVEISMCLYEAGKERAMTLRIRPDITITKGAEAVHGISMEDLADSPRFPEVADQIESFLATSNVLVGYNVRFDIRFVEEEFKRMGRVLDLSDKLVVDPLRIWQVLEPRTLTDAYRRFVGGSLEDAHSAEADVQAAVNVLRGMRRTFNLEESTWEDLAALTQPEKTTWVGPTNHLVWSAGEVVFGFGKWAGRSILEVARRDRSYVEWVNSDRADFPAHVRSVCRGALSRIDEETFHARISATLGGPPPSE